MHQTLGFVKQDCGLMSAINMHGSKPLKVDHELMGNPARGLRRFATGQTHLGVLDNVYRRSIT